MLLQATQLIAAAAMQHDMGLAVKAGLGEMPWKTTSFTTIDEIRRVEVRRAYQDLQSKILHLLGKNDPPGPTPLLQYLICGPLLAGCNIQFSLHQEVLT